MKHYGPKHNSSNGGDQKHGMAPASEVSNIGKENWANAARTKPKAAHDKSFKTEVMAPKSIKPAPQMKKKETIFR